MQRQGKSTLGTFACSAVLRDPPVFQVAFAGWGEVASDFRWRQTDQIARIPGSSFLGPGL